ncbi:MAG TPA: 1-deoxy-D-xylulose-5-phosphate reductoisomerase [Thermomicrobiaceae bacterium]|nr:1-deoxy-D-xylulose-5-phosphate reductoisomerase [Thermomicrobiaceae bacterium]
MTHRLAILGSTGSIGRQTLAVVDEHPGEFEIVALGAGHDGPLLREQVARYRPAVVAIGRVDAGSSWPDVESVAGETGMIAVATMSEADIVVVATSGHAAMRPTLAAAGLGKTIALANKEVIVCAGEILMPLARDRGAEIRPVDSEHSALWQCLGAARTRGEVAKIILTASGGPFRLTPLDRLHEVSVAEAMAHPTWNMGKKITIDSATLMNKGLEVIEAHWLFDFPYEQIDTVIHPQSVVHALVALSDGAIMGHLGVADMRLPIQYALTYPERGRSSHLALDLCAVGPLEFFPPDVERFPSLRLAHEAGQRGGTYPTVLSAADEAAVAAFMGGEIQFTAIPAVVESVLDRHRPASEPLTVEGIAEADDWARREAATLIGRPAAAGPEAT